MFGIRVQSDLASKKSIPTLHVDPFRKENSPQLANTNAVAGWILAGGPGPKEVIRAIEGECLGSLAFGNPGARKSQPGPLPIF